MEAFLLDNSRSKSTVGDRQTVASIVTIYLSNGKYTESEAENESAIRQGDSSLQMSMDWGTDVIEILRITKYLDSFYT